MNDEEQLFAALSDDDWNRRVKKIEREFKRDKRKKRRRGSLRRALRRTLMVVLPIAIIVGVIASFISLKNEDDSNTNSAIVPVLSTPTATLTTSSTASSKSVDPFATTPARTWLDAANGVVMPAPTQVGPFSIDTVNDALQNAYRYLVIGHTDASVTVRHDLSQVSGLIDGDLLSQMDISSPVDARTLDLILFAPGASLLAPPRVNGTITDEYVAETGDEPEYLSIDTNLVWAYALTAPDASPHNSPIVLIHEVFHLKFYLSDRGSQGKIWPSSTGDGFIQNMDCGYIHAGLLSLPRADDPDRKKVVAPGTLSSQQLYDPRTDIPVDPDAAPCTRPTASATPS
jgi:hypothetical protein